MADHKIKITATNAEEFAKIDERLNALPEVVFNQIESADNGAGGLTCTIKETYTDVQMVTLPPGVSQIQPFGDYIGIYCGIYFFKITTDKPIKYVFLNEKK